MTRGYRRALTALSLLIASSMTLLNSSLALAAPALDVLGKDFVFPEPQPGLPARLSD